MARKIKIGFPKALLWYKYHSLWETFFQRLGCEIVRSPDTDKKTVELGVRKSVDELCIPIKIFYGHCFNIADKCDLIFIPRYMRVDKKGITCPKIITAADTANQILKSSFPNKILTTLIDVRRRSIFISFFFLGLKVNKNPLTIVRAYRAAVKAKKMREIHLAKEFQRKLAGRGINLALISHEYNLFDEYINQELISEIEKQNVNVITSDLVPKSIRDECLKEIPFIYWSYEREIMGAAYWAFSSREVSGIILISSFNCGPDSLLYEQFMLEDLNKPIISIIIDEYTSKETIKTRIDAFIELLDRKVNVQP